MTVNASQYTQTVDAVLAGILTDHGNVVNDTPADDPPAGGWLFDQRYTGTWDMPDPTALGPIIAALRVQLQARIARGATIHVVRTPHLYQWESGWGIRAVFAAS